MRRSRSSAAALLAAISVALVACGGDEPQPQRESPVPAPPAPVVGGAPAPMELGAARSVAAAFLRGYLPYLYGRSRGERVPHVSATVRKGLARARARETPTQRSRRPRVVDVRLVAQRPDAVIATATIADGGAAPYPLTFTLVRRDGRWLVNSLGSD